MKDSSGRFLIRSEGLRLLSLPHLLGAAPRAVYD